jgi:hypothetical protein
MTFFIDPEMVDYDGYTIKRKFGPKAAFKTEAEFMEWLTNKHKEILKDLEIDDKKEFIKPSKDEVNKMSEEEFEIYYQNWKATMTQEEQDALIKDLLKYGQDYISPV